MERKRQRMEPPVADMDLEGNFLYNTFSKLKHPPLIYVRINLYVHLVNPEVSHCYHSIIPLFHVGSRLHNAVGSMPDNKAGGHKFKSHQGRIFFVEIDHEIFSSVTFSSLLIQEVRQFLAKVTP